MLARLTLASSLLAAAGAAFAAQPQFWRIEGARDFLDGESEGLSVDSEGRVRLAPAGRVLHDPEAPYVWCLARDERGAVYAGTGNDGKVFRLNGSEARLLFDAEELEVHAIAAGPDGRLYVGTSPDGKVYAVDRDGKAETFYDPSDRYIWALAFDSGKNLLVATGLEGRVHRVDPKGKAEVLLTTPETHVVSLATDQAGHVYAGSSPGGIVYRIDAAGTVFVLHDSAFREAKAIDVGADGSVYVALVEAKEREEARPSAPPQPPPAPASGGAEVSVSESFVLPAPAAAPVPGPAARPAQPSPATGARGAVLQLRPGGEIETLWSSADELPHALLATADGILIGTGNKGKLYRIRDERRWTMVATLPAEQVTALARGEGGALLLASSNPGRLHQLDAGSGTRGSFTSKPRDADTISSWGRLRWEGETPAGTQIQVQTRSGNTSAPDTTWSDWSAPLAPGEGEPVASPRARFLQVRGVLVGAGGASPVLDSVLTAYLQRNLRPQVQAVTAHPPGEVFQKPISVTGEIEILGLDPDEAADVRPGAPPRSAPTAPATSFSRKLHQRGIQTFTWKAEDPNGDALVYDVLYRKVGEARYRTLRRGLTEPVLAWDTSSVPNGRYQIRVSASDSPGNPAALALAGEKDSDPFEIDNTPPSLQASLASRSPVRIRAVARDDASPLRRAEYAVDGGRWREVHPADGINDAREESYEFQPAELPGPGPHVVLVRVSDQLGNLAAAQVEVP